MKQEILFQQIKAMEKEALSKMESDKFRQGYHLMPLSGWMNDPNGLCYYKGNYHVFFQHSPLDANRGDIFWGHFTSEDMLNWVKQPNFLYPVDAWDVNGVYSGSALVEEDALYLYYTGNVKHPGDYDYIYEGRGHNVGLAITKEGILPDSNKCLLENTDYPSDLSCHVRDPKVWKMEGKYYMVLGARTKNDKGELLIFESDDKFKWKHINVIKTDVDMGYMWECPDIFCVDGQWVVMTSPQGMKPHGDVGQNVYSCGYFPLYGDFRGDYVLGQYHEADMGFDYYAPQTFLAPDGRRIVIGWMGMPDADYTNPTAKNMWQHCMSIPRRLNWENNKLYARPIEELKELRVSEKEFVCENTVLLNVAKYSELLFDNCGNELNIAIGNGVHLSWKERKVKLIMDEDTGFGRTERFISLPKVEKIQLFIDASSIEVFFNDGEYVMSSRFYSKQTKTIRIDGVGKGVLYELKPMKIKWEG